LPDENTPKSLHLKKNFKISKFSFWRNFACCKRNGHSIVVSSLEAKAKAGQQKLLAQQFKKRKPKTQVF
jgi:hypothetical protein